MKDPVNINIKISKDIDKYIRAYGIKNDLTRTEAIRSLVKLALSKPNAKQTSMSGSREKNATLKLSKQAYSSTNDYRVKHGLSKKTKFFEDALLRGIAIAGGGEGN